MVAKPVRRFAEGGMFDDDDDDDGAPLGGAPPFKTQGYGGALQDSGGYMSVADPTTGGLPSMGGLTPEQLKSMPPEVQQLYNDGRQYTRQGVTTGSVLQQKQLDAVELKKAKLQEAYDNLTATKPDNTALLLALGSGLMAPTRTGSFGESLSNAGQAALPQLNNRTALEEARKKARLEYQLGIAGADAESAKIGYAGAKDQMTLGRGMTRDAMSVWSQQRALEQRAADARSLAKLRADFARDAAKTATDAKTSASTTAFIQSLDADGKHVLGTLGGPSVLETPEGIAKFQQALREYSGMAEEPPEQRKTRLVTMGLPDMVADPFAGLPVKKRAEAQASMLKLGQTELDKAQGVVDAARKLRENGRRFMETSQSLNTGAKYSVPGAIALSPEAKAANDIATNMAPDFRNGLPGAASDTDVRMFAAGAPSLTKSRQANANLVKAYELAAENAENQHAFKEAYLAQHKTLVGANSAWARYLKDNPIFDFDEKAMQAGNAEAYKLNGARSDWQTYFREEVAPTKLPPDVEGSLKAQLTPGNGATLPDGSVWTITNSGNLKRVR